jgi:hypothetical protein
MSRGICIAPVARIDLRQSASSALIYKLSIAAVAAFLSEVAMRSLMSSGLLAAAFGMVLAMSSTLPASAQLARPQTAIAVSADNDPLTTVRYRGGGYRRGWGGAGAGIGLGIGLAAGALIGGALSAPYYYGTAPGVYYGPPGGAVGYCLQRFKSYDPASGTYLGYDGFRHPCP